MGEPTVDPSSLLEGLDIEIPDAGARAGRAEARTEDPHFFGPYQLIQQVGAGGIARVMRARHIHPRYAETTFAVKILHPQLSRDPEVVELFRHEAFVLSLLQHPNIVRTFEAGSQDGELFIAMEYIDGRDLDNMLARCQRTRSPLPLHVGMHILAEVLKALAYAHEMHDADGRALNLVHRDVNPANVFLSYGGGVKLGDFGVASVAAAGHHGRGEVVGKPGYFAPEILTGDAIDQRTDVFSAGVMMYEMLTGTRLFPGETAEEILRANKRAKIPRLTSVNPDVPPALEAVVLRALERSPRDRFACAREMIQAVNGFLPSPVGMPLAVAALMRKVFLPEHIEELQLREGLSGVAATRGSGQLVAIASGDERAQAAFHELLLSRGYRTEICPSGERLAAVVASPNLPALVVADVCSRGFSPAAFVGAMAKSPRPVPVVALAEELSAQWIHYADAIGAVDLLFKPLNVERVLTAVRAATTGNARGDAAEVTPLTRQLGATPRVLVVSRDPELAVQLAKGLSKHGFEIDVSPTSIDALERTAHASYHAFIYDTQPPTPADRLFTSQLRSRPAMGLVPVLFLTGPGAESVVPGGDAGRCAARPRAESPAAIAVLLQALLNDNRLGRIFLRYPIALPIELRYGGRVFNCQSIDISRGGVMMRCEQMPPVGTAVGVAVKLPGVPAVEVNGRINRVDLPSGSDEQRAGIGVEFERFAGRGETVLITFLAGLDPAALSKRTLILDAPGQPRH